MEFAPGWIIGFSGRRWFSDFINIATYGIPRYSLSHVGILSLVNCKKLCDYSELNYGSGEDRYVTLLFESTSHCNEPCAIQGCIVNGVQAHFLDNRINNYHGKVWVYPLVNKLRPLANARLEHFLCDQLGKTYDYIGAIRAGGLGFSWIESLLHSENLSSIFCSELCAAAHKHVKVMSTDNFSKWNPNHFVRFERRNGILLNPERIK